jgi:hypothetical protein
VHAGLDDLRVRDVLVVDDDDAALLRRRTASDGTMMPRASPTGTVTSQNAPGRSQYW